MFLVELGYGVHHVFWRWALPFQAKVRDGTPLFIYYLALPANTPKQQDNPDPARQEQLKQKVNRLRTKTYIGNGFMLSILTILDYLKEIQIFSWILMLPSVN